MSTYHEVTWYQMYVNVRRSPPDEDNNERYRKPLILIRSVAILTYYFTMHIRYTSTNKKYLSIYSILYNFAIKALWILFEVTGLNIPKWNNDKYFYWNEIIMNVGIRKWYMALQIKNILDDVNVSFCKQGSRLWLPLLYLHRFSRYRYSFPLVVSDESNTELVLKMEVNECFKFR